jgi:hypothetical protein
MAGALPAPTSTALRGLLNPRLTDATSTALGERGRVFDPLPHNTLRAIGQDADPAGLPVPLLLSGVTDGRFFARLGIQTYGFLPLNLPPWFDFTRLIHAADERLPVAALDFGSPRRCGALAKPRRHKRRDDASLALRGGLRAALRPAAQR